MDSIELACLSRVRMLALVEMTRAGGTPAPWQLRRAVEPVLGDLLDALRAGGPRPEARPNATSDRLSTVDTCKGVRRKRRA